MTGKCGEMRGNAWKCGGACGELAGKCVQMRGNACNYAQMRAEYLYTHARLRGSSRIVRGKTTAELAGLDKSRLENVFDFIMFELVRDMAQHGLHPRMIESPIRQRIRELQEEDERNRESQGYRLGGGGEDATTAAANGVGGAGAGRELARLATERRAREQQRKKTDGER